MQAIGTAENGRSARVGPGTAYRFASIALVVILLGLQASCQPGGGIFSLSPPSARVLFIGNSYTFYNGGVDQELRGLDRSIEVKQVTAGGYSLKDHWEDGLAVNTIRSQKWDFVVLQEQSQAPVTDQSTFLSYASRLNGEIRADGAETVLFMTWQRSDSVQYGVTTQNLASAYYGAGSQLGARVAPVGLAFARALRQRPDLALNIQDGHPTPQGTYLAACVIYATILQKSPVGRSYAPSGVTAEQRDFLQKIAAEVMGY